MNRSYEHLTGYVGWWRRVESEVLKGRKREALTGLWGKEEMERRQN